MTTLLPGKIHNIPPEPLVPEQTTFYRAGAITIGIEPRHITQESLRESFKDNPRALAAMEAAMAANDNYDVDDGGLSIHVIDASTDHEYVRFDCFDEDPHYHYVHKTDPDDEPQNHWIRFDPAANGRITPWARQCLTHRISEMLSYAGAEELANQVDQAEVARVVEGIPELNEGVLARS